MPAHTTPPNTLPSAPPSAPPNPALLTLLADIALLGRPVVELASSLAAAENATTPTLLADAAHAAQALVDPPSLAAALSAGHEADASRADREAAATRLATVTACYEKSTRSIRRTVALHARLASGRPFAPLAPQDRQARTSDPQAPRPTPTPRRNPDLDAPEGLDPPDSLDDDALETDDTPDDGDELGHMTTEQARASIDRDMADAEADAALLTNGLTQAPDTSGVPPRAPNRHPAPNGHPAPLCLTRALPPAKPPPARSRPAVPDG